MSEVSMQRMEGRSFKGAVSWVVGKGLQALSIWYIVRVQDWAKNFSLSWLQVYRANYTQPSGEWLSNVFLALAKFAVRRPKTRWVVATVTWKHSLSKHPWFGNSAKVFRPYSKNSHSMSGSSIWASLECQCCFWIAEGWCRTLLCDYSPSSYSKTALTLKRSSDWTSTHWVWVSF